jgi:hypothetical protein
MFTKSSAEISRRRFLATGGASVAAKPGARTDDEWGKSFQGPADFVAWCTKASEKLSPLLLPLTCTFDQLFGGIADVHH